MKTRVGFRPVLAALGVALFAISTAADATVYRVFPGESIQDAIDAAAPGDTILVEPGVYTGGMRAMPHKQWQKNLARIKQLDKMARRIAALEKQLERYDQALSANNSKATAD